MRKYIKILLDSLIILIITFILIEIFTRVFIKKIPINIIYHFNQDIRTEVILKLGLISKKDFNEIIRDDNGPPLFIYKPNLKINENLSDTDAKNIKTTDQNGFCNDINIYNNTSIDIIMLGDSYTWCFAVEPNKTFSYLVQEKNNMISYNLGKGGIGIFEHIQLLKRFGLDKNSKYVFLNIYEGNDLRDAIRYYAYKYPSANSLKELIIDTNKDFTVFKYSLSLNLFRAIVKEISLNLFKGNNETLSFKKFSLSINIANKYKNFKYDLVFDDKIINFNYGNNDLDETNSAIIVNENPSFLNLFDEALLNFKKLSIKYNFTPIVTYVPSTYTAYNEFVKFHDDSLTNLMQDFSNKQRTYLENKITNLDLNFIDFTLPFRQHANIYQEQKLLYFPINRHLTSTGHEVIAKKITDFLSYLRKIEKVKK